MNWIYLLSIVVTFGFAVLLTGWVRRLALRKDWLDDPSDERKVHEVPIPRIGGVAMVLSTGIGLLFYVSLSYLFNHTANLPPFGIMFAGLVIIATGILDDFYNFSSRQKLLGQIIAVCITLYTGLLIPIPDLQVFGTNLSYPLSLFITAVWLLGVVNAVNLLDGLDGLAAGTSLISIIGFATLYALTGTSVNVIMACVLLGAILGFLVHNTHPATIFMGDTGSLFIGFLLGVFALPAFPKHEFALGWFAPIFIIGVPILDVFTSITRRKLLGVPIFSPDKDHIHHRIMRVWKLPHDKTVVTLYVLAFLFACAGVLMRIVETNYRGFVLFTVVLGIAIFYWHLRYFRPIPEEVVEQSGFELEEVTEEMLI